MAAMQQLTFTGSTSAAKLRCISGSGTSNLKCSSTSMYMRSCRGEGVGGKRVRIRAKEYPSDGGPELRHIHINVQLRGRDAMRGS